MHEQKAKRKTERVSGETYCIRIVEMVGCAWAAVLPGDNSGATPNDRGGRKRNAGDGWQRGGWPVEDGIDGLEELRGNRSDGLSIRVHGVVITPRDLIITTLFLGL